MLIYSPHITPRLQYVLQYIFSEQFCLPFTLTDNKPEFLSSNSAQKIVYSKKNIGDSFFIFSDELLFENDIKEFKISNGTINNNIVLFKHDKKDALGFDVFAATFYLLSRYEEYLGKPTDKFGNYYFKNSILHQLNCMHIAVVERWLNMLKCALKEQFPSLQFKQCATRFALSFDIDVAYEYNNRSLARTIGGIAKKIINLKFTELKDQLLTLAHFKKDAFDTYDYIFNTIKNNRAIVFFNMGKYARYDKNPSYRNKKFQNLIKRVHEKHIVGIHPSYASNSNYGLLAIEKNQLEKIIDEKIINSRQHYLKLEFPATYEQLIKNGVEKDFTIGYHDTYGFRAGTCNSFLFFNLKKNQATSLRLFPFAFMEGTLNDVLKLDVQTSKKIISDLIDEVCMLEGMFIPLWHNSTLFTKEKREIFEYMVDEIERRKMQNLFAD